MALTAQQSKQLSLYVKRYNDLIYRTAKRHPDKKGMLPSKVKKSELLKQIETGEDFAEIERRLTTLAGRTGVVETRGGVKTTQYVLEETERFYERQKTEREKLREKVMESGVFKSEKEKEEAGKKLYRGEGRFIQGVQDLPQPQFEEAARVTGKQLTNKYTRAEAQYKENYLNAVNRKFGNPTIDRILYDTLRDVDTTKFIAFSLLDYSWNIGTVYTFEDMWDYLHDLRVQLSNRGLIDEYESNKMRVKLNLAEAGATIEDLNIVDDLPEEELRELSILPEEELLEIILSEYDLEGVEGIQ